MALLGWLWLASPFIVIGVISRDPELLALVSLHHRRCTTAGWIGVGMMVLGAALISGVVGAILFLFGTPLAGLAVWGLRDDGHEDDEQGPDTPPIDWGEFERSFWAYARRRPRHPRVPSAG
jgi:hypothetical protein